MAEQAASAVAAAVIGGVTDRALATVMRKMRSGSNPAASHDKLQRLETLVLKLRCVVEVSEKHAIRSASLLEWRERLRAAAAEGGAIVLDFQRRAREDGGGDALATSVAGGVPGQHQQQEQPAGAMYFTRSALFGMAKRVREVTRRLFSADEDAKKLDGALEKLERCFRDTTQFLLAVQLEVLPELGQRRRLRAAAKRSAPATATASTPADERTQRRKVAEMGDCQFEQSWELPSPCSAETESSGHWVTQCQWHSVSEHGSKKAVTSSEMMALLKLAAAAEEETVVDPAWEARMLVSVLEPTLLCTERFYVKGAEGRDMGGLVWLPAWAALIREAVERGNALLQTLRATGGGGALDLEEDGELYSFVRVMERLAYGEAFWWDLCPQAKQTI